MAQNILRYERYKFSATRLIRSAMFILTDRVLLLARSDGSTKPHRVKVDACKCTLEAKWSVLAHVFQGNRENTDVGQDAHRTLVAFFQLKHVVTAPNFLYEVRVILRQVVRKEGQQVGDALLVKGEQRSELLVGRKCGK